MISKVFPLESVSTIIPLMVCVGWKMDGKDVIKWAAELAEIFGFLYVDPFQAIVNAYDIADEQNRLKVNDIGLFYDFSEVNLSVTLVRKDVDGGLTVIA